MRKLIVILTLGSLAAGAAAQPERLALRSAVARLELDAARGGAVRSFVDLATGRDFAARRAEPVLFWVALSKPGDASGQLEWLNSSDAESASYDVSEEAGRKTVTIAYRNLGGRRIHADCAVSAADGEDMIRWRIRIHGAEPSVLEEVGYPVITLRAPIGDDAGSERLAAGLTKGGVCHEPSRWPLGTTLHARQPGELAAQFGCCYDARCGFYSATADSRGYPKALQFRRNQDGLQLAWRRPCFHELAEPFEPGYEVLTSTFRSAEPDRPTDWRDAADIYREWALEQPWCARTLARRDDLPDWLRDGPAMVRFNREWLGRPERIEAWLSGYWRPRFADAPLIVAFWGWERVASWISPDYFPPYPSEEGLARCVRAAKAVGGHPFFWPSGYHWAETYGKQADGGFEWDDRQDFRQTGLPHAVLNRDGTPWSWTPPWLRGGTNRALCRGDLWTRRWLNDIAVELTGRGADMIQVDQVVGGLAPGGGACFSRNHGHPPGPGLWDTEAFVEQLDTMREECQRLNPDIVIGIEEPQELHIQQVGIQDYRDYQSRYGEPKQAERASVIAYLYHDFVPFFQSNPRPGDLHMMAYCLVTGQVPHLVPHWPMEPSPALRNGGFESWDGDVPDGWEHVKGYRGQDYAGRPCRDEAVRHTGRYSLRIESKEPDDIGQVSQNVPIGPNALKPGQGYRFSVWSRAASSARPNNAVVGAFDAEWEAKGVWMVPLADGEEWRRGEVEFTMPAGALRLRIMLHVVGTATVWLDDVALEELGDDGSWKPAMRTGLPPEHELAARWVELFHGEGRPYLLLGRMVHPPRLEVARDGDGAAAVLHNAFRAPDGSEAVIAVNATDQPQRCTLHRGGAARALAFAPWEAKLIKE